MTKGLGLKIFEKEQKIRKLQDEITRLKNQNTIDVQRIIIEQPWAKDCEFILDQIVMNNTNGYSITLNTSLPNILKGHMSVELYYPVFDNKNGRLLYSVKSYLTITKENRLYLFFNGISALKEFVATNRVKLVTGTSLEKFAERILNEQELFEQIKVLEKFAERILNEQELFEQIKVLETRC